MADDRATSRWRFDRSVARLTAVDGIVAEYATTYCGLPFRRRDVVEAGTDGHPPGVEWSIDGAVVVEYLHDDAGPGRLVVYEISLLGPLRKHVRSRHVKISYAQA